MLFYLFSPSGNITLESLFAYLRIQLCINCKMQSKRQMFCTLINQLAPCSCQNSSLLSVLTSRHFHQPHLSVCQWTSTQSGGWTQARNAFPSWMLRRERVCVCLHKRDKWVGLVVDSCAVSQLKFWQTSLTKMSRRAKMEGAGGCRREMRQR